jgi:hypothetical protein
VCDEDIIYSSVRPNQLHYGFIKNPVENLVVSTGFVVISCDNAPRLWLFVRGEVGFQHLTLQYRLILKMGKQMLMPLLLNGGIQ